jgi:hypothetical protein
MIGWKPRPFIFVHIPKCAGTSIEACLIPAATSSQTFQGLSAADRSLYWLPSSTMRQHAELLAYAKHYSLEGYFKFVFVRNPWDRAVSQINFLRVITQTPLFQNKSFKEQVRIYCNTKARIWGHDLGLSQVDYILRKSGDVGVDFIGRFESLSVSFQKVCEIIGIDPAPNVPHVFNSKRVEHYSAFFDEESADWIRCRFARDIDFFGYSFEKPCASELINK